MMIVRVWLRLHSLRLRPLSRTIALWAFRLGTRSVGSLYSPDKTDAVYQLVAREADGNKAEGFSCDEQISIGLSGWAVSDRCRVPARPEPEGPQRGPGRVAGITESKYAATADARCRFQGAAAAAASPDLRVGPEPPPGLTRRLRPRPNL